LGTNCSFTFEGEAARMAFASPTSSGSAEEVTKTGAATFAAAVRIFALSEKYSPGEKASTAATSLGCAAASTNESAAE
jgi:hypothetical protein